MNTNAQKKMINDSVFAISGHFFEESLDVDDKLIYKLISILGINDKGKVFQV